MAAGALARIAVLGGGPIGLEAALYARFLGYDVDIYERRQVAGNVLRWGHVRMFSPFRLNRSPLGLAALAAQDPAYSPPDEEQSLSGRQWAEAYLIPLSQTDLLADNLHQRTTVVSVGRDGPLKVDFLADDRRADAPFRLLLRDADGGERAAAADIVIDTTGTYDNPNWLGRGGIPAVGEIAARPDLEYSLPDVLGAQRDHYAGRHTLLIGSGYSAATSAVALARLASQTPQTRVTWITRNDRPATVGEPIARIPDDGLPERDRLAVAANRLVEDDAGQITHWPGTTVDGLALSGEPPRLTVQLLGRHGGTYEFDRIIANVGYRPDGRIYTELQVHQCYASEGPMKLAAALLGQSSADCLDQESHGPQTLLNPEPNFYVLGSKSYGRNSRFLFSVGLEQVRELFTIIGDRHDLDLYSNVTSLLP